MLLHRSWDQVSKIIMEQSGNLTQSSHTLDNQVIGPIVSGWIVETRLGWRFNFWLMFIISALSWITAYLVSPETVGSS